MQTNDMEQVLLKAATTAADQGLFTAVISTTSIDREGDIVSPQGMVNALHKWAPLGKKLPLSWNHSLAPEDIIGWIDPGTAKVVGNEVEVDGWVDQTVDRGKEAWRLVKSGTLGFSYGYIPLKAPRRKGGKGRDIMELDVYEITATPAPMNGDTRVVGWKSVKAASDVGPAARAHLENLIKYYMSKPHPFTECVRDNTKRFGEDGAKRVCATLKDIGEGTTNWRDGKAAAPNDTTPTADPVQALYDAANGDLEALLEMLHEWVQANGGKSLDELRRMAEETEVELGLKADPVVEATVVEEVIPDWAQGLYDAVDGDVKVLNEALRKHQAAAEAQPPETLRKHAEQLDREDRERELGISADTHADKNTSVAMDIEEAKQALLAQELLHPDEVNGLQSGLLKAVWSAAFINSLPDSSFLYIAPGGSKDSDGKTTPRSLRYFPYKDASGSVDLAHLRNALARIPQSNLPKAIKDRLTSKAQRILNDSKSVDETGKEREARPVDPLRRQADAVALEFATDGLSRKSPRKVEQPKRELLPLEQLKKRMHDEILTHLSGETT